MLKLMEISGDAFATEVLESTMPVVVEFYTPTCKFCKRFDPIIETLADRYEGSVKFLRINAAENREIAMQFDVFGVPTTIIFRSGDVVDRISGFVPEAELANRIDAIVK
ncbi:MAG TPA: thioredoxin family protein [Planctomycetota bacterium]|nr:thioredoxin family protein [Planctomycetota bacterium]